MSFLADEAESVPRRRRIAACRRSRKRVESEKEDGHEDDDKRGEQVSLRWDEGPNEFHQVLFTSPPTPLRIAPPPNAAPRGSGRIRVESVHAVDRSVGVRHGSGGGGSGSGGGDEGQGDRPDLWVELEVSVRPAAAAAAEGAAAEPAGGFGGERLRVFVGGREAPAIRLVRAYVLSEARTVCGEAFEPSFPRGIVPAAIENSIAPMGATRFPSDLPSLDPFIVMTPAPPL